MEYQSGGGTSYDGGIWDVKETKKRVVFTVIKEPFFTLHFKKLICPKDNSGQHKLEDFFDGYVVYPFRSGVPHFFEPLDKRAK